MCNIRRAVFCMFVSVPFVFFASAAVFAGDANVGARLVGSNASSDIESESPWDDEAFSEEAETGAVDSERGFPVDFDFVLWNKFARDTKDDDDREGDYYNHVRGIASAEYRYSDGLYFKAALQGDYFFYRYDDGWENDDDFRVHETFFNYSGPGYNAKIGSQIVRWGKADGFSPLDNVNPEDYRDGIAGRREDRKIPVPMANLQFYRGPVAIQGVFIPFFEKSELDIVDTDWALFDRVEERIGPFSYDDPDFSASFEDAQGGGRVSLTVGGYDFALSYLNKINDLPSIDTLATPPGFVSPNGLVRDLPLFAQQTGQTIRLRYDRTSIWGLEFETAAGDFVLRGDLAYRTDANYLTESFEKIEKSVIDCIVGFDYNSPDNLYVNLQFGQTIVQNWDDRIAYSKETTSAVSGTISREFDNGNLKPEFRFYYDLEGDASIFNPKLLLYYWQNLAIDIGAEFFDGEDTTLIGLFKDNDQLYLSMELKF